MKIKLLGQSILMFTNLYVFLVLDNLRMTSLQNYWSVLTHIGTNKDMAYIEFKRIHMVNLISLLCIPFMVCFSIVNLIEQRQLLSVINFSNALCCSSVLLLNYYHKYSLSKIVLLAVTFIFFFAGAILYNNGGEYFLVCILIVAVLLYDNIYVQISLGTAVIVAILFIHAYTSIELTENPVPLSRVFFNITGALTFVFIALIFFKQIIFSNTKKIQDQHNKLQSINKDKEKVFSILAHDIKSPFATLENMVGALKEQVISNTVSEDFINQLHQRIVHQNQALDDLLQWSFTSMQGIVNSPSIIQIKPVVLDLIKVFDEQLHLKKISIKTTIDDETQVFADHAHLTIILRNFISNAIKFSHIHGEIEIYTSSHSDYTYVHIKDLGIGMNASKSTLLFNAIQHRSLGTFDEPGAGLGLVLCKDLIERNKGIVDIKSVLNEGSIFTIGLPSCNQTSQKLNTIELDKIVDIKYQNKKKTYCIPMGAACKL